VSRRTPPHRLLLWGLVSLIYAFMLVPIAITAAVSFNAADRSYFPPRGFSLHWWAMAASPQWTAPFLFSLKLAALSAIATAVLGLPLALALRRPAFIGRSVLLALIMGPLVLPSLVTGIALLQFLTIAGVGAWLGLPALIVGHVIICIPFMVRTLLISLEAIPRNAEIAAASLGASHLVVLREVTLPLARSGAGAGMIFAFISSFDDINLALFVARPGQQPLTVQIMQFLEYGFSPTLAALSILSLLVPLVLVAVFGRLVGIGHFIYQDHGHA